MAAETVVWENLQRALDSNVTQLPYLNELRESVRKIEGAVTAIEMGQKMDSTFEKLVALLHQADDLLDEILTLADRTRAIRESTPVDSGEYASPVLQRVIVAITKVRYFCCSNQFVLPRKMAQHLKRINKEIEQLAEELPDRFHSIQPADRAFQPPTFRGLKNDKVIGRRREKDAIIDMLVRPKTKSNSDVSVIPIVGTKGLGKSALTKFVYDDEKVKHHFDLRMWIDISHVKDEGEIEIIREIVQSCTSRKSNNGDNYQAENSQHHKIQQIGVPNCNLLGCKSFGTSVTTPKTSSRRNEMENIERRLQKEIDGKLYLLVLDDVRIPINWPHLKELLAGGARGSKILMTTRYAEIANLAKAETNDEYQLKGLPFDDSWSLFKALAVPEGHSMDRAQEKAGKSIARSCEGVPLAIRVAGSLLYDKSMQKWLSFEKEINFCIENDGKDVMDHILEHSYNDLPTRLKACISYCSLFPEDFNFNKHNLISLWIAQGFVDPQHNQCLEDAGSEYLLELYRRCFLQEVSTDDLDNIVTWKMHPLIHKLAYQHAEQTINIHREAEGRTKVLNAMSKHVSFSCNRDSSVRVPRSLCQAQSLRTLLSVNEPDYNAKLNRLTCNMLMSKFRCLRVLDVHNLQLEELSDSIGNLIHLRYLDLSKNDLEILPESMTKLYNLQTLRLNCCSKLRRLPGDFGELINLRRFEVDECDSLAGMPVGLERLTQLVMLSRFVVGNEYSRDFPTVGLKALEKLSNLREQLEIELTGDWMKNINEGSQADLRNKSKLTQLKINWSQTISDVERSSSVPSEDDKSQYWKLLQHLQPHPNLKILRIEGYKGADFPSWAMSASSLKNLVVISIEGCDKCQHLPPFGELESLKQLTLRHMGNVEYVESNESSVDGHGEAMSKSSSFFQSLEQLTLHNFYKLKGWRKEVMMVRHHMPVRCFPKLTVLRIWNCPKLTSMPLFHKVSKLDLRNVDQKLLEDCAQKTTLGIRQPKNVSCIEKLLIGHCITLKNFAAVRKGLGALPKLEHLVINRCDALTSLASEFWYLTSLKELKISGCNELDLSKNGTRNTRNSDLASWISLGPFQNLTPIGIQQNPWSSLKNLRHLSLKEIPKMKGIPPGLTDVQSLKSLWISMCKDLEELPESISNLMVLQHLRIVSCPALKRLPDGIKKVRSLIKVEIYDCAELMERCREHTGEDWHKIKQARILLHKSWRYGLMSDLRASKKDELFGYYFAHGLQMPDPGKLYTKESNGGN